MYFRLSRVAFWLAAAAAGWALVASDARFHSALTIAIGAGAAALVLRWLGERTPVEAAAPPSAPVHALDRHALQEAADALQRAVHHAAFFDAALQAAARVLRNELGALELDVVEVRSIDEGHASVAEAIEAQPGFHAVARRIRLDAGPLGEALQSQREVVRVPIAVVPVIAGGAAVAAIELGGIGLAIDPAALADLLRLARLLLSERARPLEGDAAQVERNPVFNLRPADRAGVDSGMLGGLAEQADRPRPPALAALDLDDPHSEPDRPEPARADQMLSPLNSPSRRSTPTDPAALDAAGGMPAAGVAEALDAAALARLTELDPTGVNQLLARVMRAFQTSSERLRGQGRLARQTGDRAALKLVVHTLKSSSASVGALRLSRLCAQIETRIRLEDATPLDADLDAMEAALDATLQAIARLLERPA